MVTRATLPWPVLMVGQLLVLLVVFAIGLGAAYAAFVWYPEELLDLVGIILVLVIGVLALRSGGAIAGRVFPGYNAAEVAVEGPITRDGGQPMPTAPGQPGADDIVEQIELADADPAVQGLLLKLNTPGGQVVPSDDIRAAAASFDGPTVAYTTDICASGGYWIASGCDELIARDASIVGSIGVRGSRLNVSELADRLGISHEQFTAGRFKDAGSPFRELEDEERDYLQGIVDDHYDAFIDRVSEGRDIDAEALRDTEARVYLGEEAHELGLVDAIGDSADAEEALADRLGIEDVRVRPFEPVHSLAERLRGGVERVAFAAGAGVAARFSDSEIALPDRP